MKKHTSGAPRQGTVEALHSASSPKPKGLTPSALGDGLLTKQDSNHPRLLCSRGKPGSPPGDQGVNRAPQGSGREPAGSCTLRYRAGSRQGLAAPS